MFAQIEHRTRFTIQKGKKIWEKWGGVVGGGYYSIAIRKLEQFEWFNINICNYFAAINSVIADTNWRVLTHSCCYSDEGTRYVMMCGIY